MLCSMDTVLASLDLTTLQTRLDEASGAYHLLAMGQKEVSVKIGDTDVTYTAASMSGMRRYMNELQSAIAFKQGGPGRRAIHPVAG